MNCSRVQNWLLDLPNPEEVPGALQNHLDTCANCQAWYQAFLKMEQAIPILPVPQPDPKVKAALLYHFQLDLETAPSLMELAVRPRPRPRTQTEPERSFLGRNWPMITVAAALLVGFFAWMNLPNGPNPELVAAPADPLVDQLVQFNVSLAKSDKATEKIETLSQLANELEGQIRTLARVDTNGNVGKLTVLYARVIEQGVLKQAKELSGPDLKLLEPIAQRLAQVKNTAEELARTVPDVNVPSFQQMAKVAQQGNQTLVTLLQGRT